MTKAEAKRKAKRAERLNHRRFKVVRVTYMNGEEGWDISPANRPMKKKNRKKRNSSRKGKMPAGLRKYWAKKRAQKRARRRKAKKNPPYHPRTVMKRFRKRKLRSRSGRRVTSPSQAKAILLSELRASGYDIAPKKNPRRRRKVKKTPRKMKGYRCGNPRCKRTFKMNSRPKSCPFCRIRFK